MKFESLEELRKRIEPALVTKVDELKRKNITCINENDIWDYLIEMKWKDAHGLSLSDMVDDILKCDMK